MKVQELYQEIILDHYRAKHHSGLRDPYEAEVDAFVEGIIATQKYFKVA